MTYKQNSAANIVCTIYPSQHFTCG